VVSCRVDWGWGGARRAASRGDAIVVVDVLRFSTAVATAVARGVTAFPSRWGDEAFGLAERHGAELAIRGDRPNAGRFSLSPSTFDRATPGTLVVLPSPNGATCCRQAAGARIVYVGAFVNASAVARAVASHGVDITVVAAGERRRPPDEDGEIRFALEDWLGTGAIVAALPGEVARDGLALSAEAAFVACHANLEHLIAGCESGRELLDLGLTDDVRRACQVDRINVAPRLVGEAIVGA
jgi:2-phosphosulfolactate phosphatase